MYITCGTARERADSGATAEKQNRFPSIQIKVTITQDWWVCGPQTLTVCTRSFSFDTDII